MGTTNNMEITSRYDNNEKNCWGAIVQQNVWSTPPLRWALTIYHGCMPNSVVLGVLLLLFDEKVWAPTMGGTMKMWCLRTLYSYTWMAAQQFTWTVGKAAAAGVFLLLLLVRVRRDAWCVFCVLWEGGTKLLLAISLEIVGGGVLLLAREKFTLLGGWLGEATAAMVFIAVGQLLLLWMQMRTWTPAGTLTGNAQVIRESVYCSIQWRHIIMAISSEVVMAISMVLLMDYLSGENVHVKLDQNIAGILCLLSYYVHGTVMASGTDCTGVVAERPATAIRNFSCNAILTIIMVRVVVRILVFALYTVWTHLSHEDVSHLRELAAVDSSDAPLSQSMVANKCREIKQGKLSGTKVLVVVPVTILLYLAMAVQLFMRETKCAVTGSRFNTDLVQCMTTAVSDSVVQRFSHVTDQVVTLWILLTLLYRLCQGNHRSQSY